MAVKDAFPCRWVYGLASVRVLAEENGGYCFFEWEREKCLFSSLIRLKASDK